MDNITKTVLLLILCLLFSAFVFHQGYKECTKVYYANDY